MTALAVAVEAELTSRCDEAGQLCVEVRAHVGVENYLVEGKHSRGSSPGLDGRSNDYEDGYDLGAYGGYDNSRRSCGRR